MSERIAILLLSAAAAWGADWNPAAAAKYLDGRAAEWAVWKRAAKEGGPCVSCHTTLGYLMARPLLRQKLGESAPTEFENGLLAGVKVRTAGAAPSPAADNTQKVLAALVLAMDDARRGKGLAAETEAALRAMWATQREDGAWGWTDANLEPWEVSESFYYGAALAAVATVIAPDGYKDRPEIRGNVARLNSYLREHREGQPLANRLVVAWADREIAGGAVAEAWSKQGEDGGWTLAALGPWRERPKAPDPKAMTSAASNAYATAWAASMLRLSGVKPGEPRMARALAWLRGHQDPAGYWDAVSMNHSYESGSMMEKFMRDAATAYAALALAP
jgi:hypothetical protein